MPSKRKYPCTIQHIRSPEETARLAKNEHQQVIRKTQFAVYNELASYTNQPNNEKCTAIYDGLYRTLLRWAMYAQELYDFATTLEGNMKRLNQPIMWQQTTSVDDIQHVWYQTAERDDPQPNQAVLTGFTQIVQQKIQEEPTPVHGAVVIDHMPFTLIRGFQQAIERDIYDIQKRVPLTHITFLQNLYTNRPFYRSHKDFDPYRIKQSLVDVSGIQLLLTLWASEP